MSDEYWKSTELNIVMRPFNQRLFAQHGNKVLHGPFKDMEIPILGDWDEWTVFLKLFGEYERELHTAIAKAISRNPAIVINIGCAGGYYAIGFGRALPCANIYAIDINNDFLAICREYANKNNVAERFHTRTGAFFTRDLAFTGVTGHRLYFLDCEGVEFDLLDPYQVPALAHSDLIVELHDESKDQAKAHALLAKFNATHEIALIPHEKRQLLTLITEWKFNNSYDGISIWDVRVDPGWMVAWAKERRC